MLFSCHISNSELAENKVQEKGERESCPGGSAEWKQINCNAQKFILNCNLSGRYLCAHSPPGAEVSLCPRKSGERKKESARETTGRVKRGSEASFPPFPSSHSPPRAYCFSFKYSYFYWNTKRVPLRRREICVCVASLGVLRKCALSFVLNRWSRQKPQSWGNETTKHDEF